MMPPHVKAALARPTDQGDVQQVVGDRESFVLRSAAWAGGASDVGLRHAPNQDAIALAAGPALDARPVAVACVSDGVSTSPHSEDASALAVETACSFLADRLRDAPDNFDLAGAIAEAFARANGRIIEAAGTAVVGTWACTLVVAVFWHGRVVIGNVGDSRCYWMPDFGEPKALSTDDSIAQAQIDLGVTREVAEASSGAHAITKWLGPGAQVVQPSLSSMPVTEDGWLLTCSDGLWNYASDPETMAEALRDAVATETKDDQDPTAWSVCCRLVDWANTLGGHDNIAVTLLRLKPAVDKAD